MDEVTCGEVGGLEDGELYRSDVVDSVARDYGCLVFGSVSIWCWVGCLGKGSICNLPDVGIWRDGDVSERDRVEM